MWDVHFRLLLFVADVPNVRATTEWCICSSTVLFIYCFFLLLLLLLLAPFTWWNIECVSVYLNQHQPTHANDKNNIKSIVNEQQYKRQRERDKSKIYVIMTCLSIYIVYWVCLYAFYSLYICFVVCSAVCQSIINIFFSPVHMAEPPNESNVYNNKPYSEVVYYCWVPAIRYFSTFKIVFYFATFYCLKANVLCSVIFTIILELFGSLSLVVCVTVRKPLYSVRYIFYFFYFYYIFCAAGYFLRELFTFY